MSTISEKPKSHDAIVQDSLRQSCRTLRDVLKSNSSAERSEGINIFVSEVVLCMEAEDPQTVMGIIESYFSFQTPPVFTIDLIDNVEILRELAVTLANKLHKNLPSQPPSVPASDTAEQVAGAMGELWGGE